MELYGQGPWYLSGLSCAKVLSPLASGGHPQRVNHGHTVTSYYAKQLSRLASQDSPSKPFPKKTRRSRASAEARLSHSSTDKARGLLRRRMKNIKIQSIAHAGFKPYGWIIDYPKKRTTRTRNLFRVVIRQPGLGWRIAYLIVRDKKINRLEQHPDSLESFEPVDGRSLLYVSTKKEARSIKCFLLDKPVILKKGLWHGVVTLSKETDIKIVENAKLKCVYWPLGFELTNSVKRKT